MLRKMVVVVVAAMFLWSPAGLCQQDAPAGRWWHTPRVVKRLGLSPEQVRQLDAAYHDSRLKLIDLKSALERERFELESLVESSSAGEAELMAQYRRMEAARVALGTERFRFFARIRKIVGPELFRQLLELRRERLKKRRKGRKPSR